MDQSEWEGWLRLISLSAGSAYWMEHMVEWLSTLSHFLHLTANQTAVVLVLRSVKLWKRWEKVDYSARLGLFIASIQLWDERLRGAYHLESRWRPAEVNVMCVVWCGPTVARHVTNGSRYPSPAARCHCTMPLQLNLLPHTLPSWAYPTDFTSVQSLDPIDVCPSIHCNPLAA